MLMEDRPTLAQALNFVTQSGYMPMDTHTNVPYPPLPPLGVGMGPMMPLVSMSTLIPPMTSVMISSLTTVPVPPIMTSVSHLSTMSANSFSSLLPQDIQGTSNRMPRTSSNNSGLSRSPSTPIKGERCVGCGSEGAIRIHYGAPSCHGCKAFFRRSVFENRSYSCASEGNCEISHESRNRCRACRFRNCQDGGMNPKHVREERSKTEKIGGQPSGPSSQEPPQSPIVEEEHAVTQFLVAIENQCEKLTDADAMVTEDVLDSLASQIRLQFGLHLNEVKLRRQPLNWNCERIMGDDDIFNTWYRAFVLLADWALAIPEFKMLPQADQSTLFRQNFMAFGWLHYAYKCLANGQMEKGMPVGNGSYIPYSEEEQAQMDPKWVPTYGMIGRKLIDMIVKPMQEMDMDENEYCILKALALFQTDNTLSETSKIIVEQQRDKLLLALSIHQEKVNGKMPESYRMMRALKGTLLFPALMLIGQIEATFVQQITPPRSDIIRNFAIPREVVEALRNIGNLGNSGSTDSS